MSKNASKEPQYLLVLAVIRQIREEGACLVRTELVDPMDGMSCVNIDDFLEAETVDSSTWFSICSGILALVETDRISSFYDPAKRFTRDDIGAVALTMAYPILFTGDLATWVEVSQTFGEPRYASDAFDDAAKMIRVLETQRGNPVLNFLNELNRLITAIRIPDIISFGQCELDVYKPILKRPGRKTKARR